MAESAPNLDNQTADAYNLGEMVVEGQAETVDKISTVDTVSQEQIRLNTSNNVADAIATTPSTALIIGKRNERTFSIRGFTQRYVPVFYDGIPISIPYDGYIDTGKLPVGPVSQINVSKGVSSVLYGCNTMGGMVNIISQKPTKRLEGSFDTVYEEGGAWHASGNVGSRVGKVYGVISVGYLDSDGFLMSKKYDHQVNEKGGRRNNSYIDGSWNGSFKIGMLPAEGHEYAFGINHVDDSRGLPPEAGNQNARFWRFTEWKKSTYYVTGDSRLTDDLKLQLRLYRDEYRNVLDSYDNDLYAMQTLWYSFHSTYDDHSTGGSALLRSTYLPNNTVSASFHCKNDVHREQDNTYAAWETYKSRTFSYGLEDDIKLTEQLSLLFGASYDVLSPQFANGDRVPKPTQTFNPQAGLSWTVFDETALHFSVGRKTRFPTLKELYSGLLGANVANPNLKAERAAIYEVGIEQPLGWQTLLRCSLFYSSIKNMIVAIPVGPASSQNQYFNIGRAVMRGIETSLATSCIPGNEIQISYTVLDAQDMSADRTSKHLEQIPRHMLYASDSLRLNRFLSFFTSITCNAGMFFMDRRNYNHWERFNGFATVDAKLIMTLSAQLKLEAGVRNLFDRNYELSPGFPREGKTLFTALRAKF